MGSCREDILDLEMIVALVNALFRSTGSTCGAGFLETDAAAGAAPAAVAPLAYYACSCQEASLQGLGCNLLNFNRKVGRGLCQSSCAELDGRPLERNDSSL